MAEKRLHGLIVASLGVAIAVVGAVLLVIRGPGAPMLVPLFIGGACGALSPGRSTGQVMGLAVPGLLVFSALAGSVSALQLALRAGGEPSLTVLGGAITGGITAALPLSLALGLTVAAITRPTPRAPAAPPSAGPATGDGDPAGPSAPG